MAIQREYLSPNEIAEYLGISPFTIRRYIKLGELKAVKLLGSFRVHKNDLQVFLKAHEVNLAEENPEEEEAEAAAVPVPPQPSHLPAPPPAVTGAPEIPMPQNPVRRPRGRPRKNPAPM